MSPTSTVGEYLLEQNSEQYSNRFYVTSQSHLSPLYLPSCLHPSIPDPPTCRTVLPGSRAQSSRQVLLPNPNPSTRTPSQSLRRHPLVLWCRPARPLCPPFLLRAMLSPRLLQLTRLILLPRPSPPLHPSQQPPLLRRRPRPPALWTWRKLVHTTKAASFLVKGQSRGWQGFRRVPATAD